MSSNVFDVLNSRNTLSTVSFKRPLFKTGEEYLKTHINDFVTYLSSLNAPNKENILHSNRKTGFLGLIVCLLSVQCLSNDLAKTNVLQFLRIYKLSQKKEKCQNPNILKIKLPHLRRQTL